MIKLHILIGIIPMNKWKYCINGDFGSYKGI
jgi:hypothetical protein